MLSDSLALLSRYQGIGRISRYQVTGQ